jgi:hypothetical protein
MQSSKLRLQAALLLLKERKRAERRYHQAKGRKARQMALFDLRQIKSDLTQYRVTYPAGGR